MLRALRGLTLSRITIHGKTPHHLTPWNDVQQRLLALMEVSLASPSGLVARFSNADFHSRET